MAERVLLVLELQAWPAVIGWVLVCLTAVFSLGVGQPPAVRCGLLQRAERRVAGEVQVGCLVGFETLCK